MQTKNTIFQTFVGETALWRVACVIGVLLFPGIAVAQLTGSEDFDDGRKSTAAWDADFVRGSGRLAESGGRVQFTNSSRSGINEAAWPWILSTASYSEDWEIQFDVENLITVVSSNQSASIGIYVASLRDATNLAYIEFYAAYFDELGRSVHGFTSSLENRRGPVNEVDTFELPVTSGAVRMDFDSSDKVLRLLYHVGDPSLGYGWQVLGHYGLDGSDGIDANENWRLGPRDEFDIGIFGYAENVVVSSGELSGDQFTADGSDLQAAPFAELFVEPSTSGSFQFGWESFENYQYRVQQSGDFQNWSQVGETIIGDGVVQLITLERDSPQSFVRILTSLP